MLAAYIGGRLLSALGDASQKISHIRVELDECDGQIGIWQSEPARSFII
jgi:hypothetical protein